MNASAPFPVIKPAVGLSPVLLPLFGNQVSAGFPSPADDYLERRLSLDEHLVPNKNSTFLVRARGTSMVDAGIFDGDLMVVDKGLNAQPGDIVVAVVDGEFTVKYLGLQNGVFCLKPANPRFQAIEFKEGQELEIWGVVTSTIKQFRR
ncbi:MAG: translesion error-prone DNA polymerase V autoproteolytic subunit [Sideroxyarcus sp.]|nr:translesion error-prone DNA polymerase V autoproteolytic subunit [Sideroxyarcus sp.]